MTYASVHMAAWRPPRSTAGYRVLGSGADPTAYDAARRPSEKWTLTTTSFSSTGRRREPREASGKAARSLNDLWHSYADLPLPCSDDYCSLHGVQQQPCVSWCADGPISMLLNPALPSSPSPPSPSSPPPALLLFFTRRHCVSPPARHLHHSSLIVC